MPLFSRTAEPDAPFKKNEIVKATIDLPGVPAGTQGKVKVINGFDWTRYWVFFDNGIDLGQLDSGELVRPAHWDLYFEAKASAAEAEARAAEAAEAAVESGAAAADTSVATDADDPVAQLRALIPAHLLERSEQAHRRLTS